MSDVHAIGMLVPYFFCFHASLIQFKITVIETEKSQANWNNTSNSCEHKRSTTSLNVGVRFSRYTLCPKKVSHLMFDNNFGKRGPIFKIISPIDSW